MKHLIAFISILMLASVVSGTATSITIYGTNRSNAQTNITCNGCNNSIYVNAWNTSYVKNITVNSSNASGDVVSFIISNVTAYQVQELKVNKTAINAYQAGANGMLNFSYNITGNKTLTLSPTPYVSGYNFTWGWFWKNATFASNVGINTTTAALVDIEVAGNIGISNDGNTNKNRYIGIMGNEAPYLGGSSAWAGIEIETVFDGAGSHDAWLHFITTDSGVIGGARRMTIDRSGDVNIVSGVLSGNGSGLSNLNASNFTIGTFIKTVTVNRSYVKDTVYQNTNSSAMFMTITAYAAGAGTSGCNYKTGTANPPTDFVGSQAEANADMQSFWVLPQHYFAAFQSTGTCTILSWSVWQ